LRALRPSRASRLVHPASVEGSQDPHGAPGLAG
jgi:hypothetical protein